MVVTAVGTGLVVANRYGAEVDSTKPATPAATTRPAPAPVLASQPAPAAPRPASTVPPRAAVDACNQHAAAQVAQHDKTTEILKDAAIGAAAGAALGAAGGAIAGGGKGAGKGAAIGGLVGAGGGSLYGLNETQKNDQRYREAYAGCMRSRGHTG